MGRDRSKSGWPARARVCIDPRGPGRAIARKEAVGLVIHEARSIPDVGQTFTFYGFRFGVLLKDRNRITSLRITPLSKTVPR